MVVKTKQTISCGGKALKRGPNKTVRQRIRISFLVFIICTKILSVSASFFALKIDAICFISHIKIYKKY